MRRLPMSFSAAVCANVLLHSVLAAALVALGGCSRVNSAAADLQAVRASEAAYCATQTARQELRSSALTQPAGGGARKNAAGGTREAGGAQDSTATALVADEAGYWRRDIFRQMGREGRQFGTRGLWDGIEAAFWDVENAFVLTAAMGASVTIRETGVDAAIRRRTDGHRQLGDMDEPIQLLGHPGTHFAGAGVLWLTSALTKDLEAHEVAKTLGQALAVNGLTTLALKAATNTRAPDGDDYAWPSGHTSSSFTAAAVLNEYYGPLVGVPSFALAGLVGYQRLDSREHDFSDVVFGAVLGYVVGSSIARDNKAKFPELFGLEVIPFTDPQTGASGVALMKSW